MHGCKSLAGRSADANECSMRWCDGYGMLLLLFLVIYLSIIYLKIAKPYFKKNPIQLGLTGVLNHK